jgi:hypothetical protein
VLALELQGLELERLAPCEPPRPTSDVRDMT